VHASWPRPCTKQPGHANRALPIDAGQGQPDELDKADASSSRPGVAREVPGTADAPVGSRVAVKPARSGQTRQRMLRQELQAVTRVVLS